MLLDIIKQIVAKEGVQILSEPRRVSAFFLDLAQHEPKAQKRAFIECLEPKHEIVKILKGVSKEEHASSIERFTQELHREGLDMEASREAIAMLCAVLFGEAFAISPSAVKYFIFNNEMRQGPYSVQDILSQLRSGQATAETLCLKQGMPNWSPIKNEPDFASFFNAPPLSLSSALQGGSSFRDSRDGIVYKIVKIGNQTWMAENLNYNVPGSKCYNNNSANAEKYGRLYDWDTAIKACPFGWHLPSDGEWNALVNAIGGIKTAGKHLKARYSWNNNGNGLNTYGFAALSGGCGSSDGNFGTIGYNGYWWSSSEYSANGGASGAGAWYMLYKSEDVSRSNYGKYYLFSIRCVQDNA
jgi:uncharacterized protein (TIGR02145 family)